MKLDVQAKWMVDCGSFIYDQTRLCCSPSNRLFPGKKKKHLAIYSSSVLFSSRPPYKKFSTKKAWLTGKTAPKSLSCARHRFGNGRCQLKQISGQIKVRPTFLFRKWQWPINEINPGLRGFSQLSIAMCLQDARRGGMGRGGVRRWCIFSHRPGRVMLFVPSVALKSADSYSPPPPPRRMMANVTCPETHPPVPQLTAVTAACITRTQKTNSCSVLPVSCTRQGRRRYFPTYWIHEVHSPGCSLRRAGI